MKKRILAVLMTAALCVGALGGCGESGNSGEEKATYSTEVQVAGASAGLNEEQESALKEQEAVTEKYDPTSVKVPVQKIGMLSMLNMAPEGMGPYSVTRGTALSLLEKEGYVFFPFQFDVEGSMMTGQVEIKFYDSLTEMQMGLMANDIDFLSCYKSVADYLTSRNDSLTSLYMYDLKKERNTFADMMMNGILGNDFSFLMLQGNEALRDEFDSAISEMKQDGTLDRLIEEQIATASSGQDPVPVAIEKIDGAQTIRVAVTGALPPMDYVAADGTPAGFNTAVLAEIGKRTGKNIELIVVDSIGRATALSSGTADAVFWTRTSQYADQVAEASEEEREQQKKELNKGLNEEELACVEYIDSILEFSSYGRLDMPENTITTQPYYSDLITNVLTKEKQNEIMNGAAGKE